MRKLRMRRWSGEDSNLRRRKAGRFTACCVWPLRYHSARETPLLTRRKNNFPDNQPADPDRFVQISPPGPSVIRSDAVWPDPELAKGLEPLTG